MDSISVKAFAKINLSLDVTGRRADGYHLIRSVMQAIDLCDVVTVQTCTGTEDRISSEPSIALSVDYASEIPPAENLPTDISNTAYKAAAEMAVCFSISNPHIKIHIQKNIPASAGLAGGSADAAAVILALNKVWQLNADLAALNEVGLRVGADVPFCLAAAAKNNPLLGLSEDPLASSAALCEGIGEILTPLPSARGEAILLKPALAVSTARIYKLFDEKSAPEERPDTETLIRYLKSDPASRTNLTQLTGNMINVLEEITASEYPVVAEILYAVKETIPADRIMMSGSGPTVFAYFGSQRPLENACAVLRIKMHKNSGLRIIITKLL
ncbi:MAG: 4-(cytidine 5'-diphospho)-2-C-methyl-D-erythritol kinase [Clostridiales Family XIII bacterium]|jgi:4-diphosphocytidyl-2-C-methyl-D-erythritol kinase|nr:4-(cytidine 5'-diphospho)-2-C-methyl-D-erythritol kinase [Clostridiales Family XIII bacterium]